jgi:6-phosphofructokinase 1
MGVAEADAPTRIGLLTGGGDCPGLNAVIRAVVRRGLDDGRYSFIGFRYGWAGLLENEAVELTSQSIAGILPRGGTILGTSRTNPYADGKDGTALVRSTLEQRGVDALIPIGGEDTSACPRRSTTTSAAPTSRSAFRPPCRS